MTSLLTYMGKSSEIWSGSPLKTYLGFSSVCHRTKLMMAQQSGCEIRCSDLVGLAPRKCALKASQNGELTEKYQLQNKDIGAPIAQDKDLFRLTPRDVPAVEQRKPLILAVCSRCSRCSELVVLEFGNGEQLL